MSENRGHHFAPNALGASPPGEMMPVLELRYHVPRSQVWEGSRGRQSGNTHAHTLAELERGRLKRRRGQALCGKRGWYERPPEYESELADRCPRCVDVAERYGLAWP